ncbi:MAG TPA: hypothetical protein VGG45_13795 [Terracidiphilus sp.]|jgi:hypothetical protein
MHIQKLKFAALLAAGSLLAAVPAFAADNTNQQQGSAVVTVMPKNEVPGGISQDALHLKVDGKDSTVTGWTPLRGRDGKVEMVVLIDEGARQSLGLQYSGVARFIQGLPPDAKVAVAYMQNGEARFSGPLTADHAAAARELHLTMPGGAGISASPYFCLSDLAKHWPSSDLNARREVVMITDGVDYYNPRYDPEDPYVQAAVQDAVRSHLVVYSIYWRNSGRFDRSGYAAFSGQNLLSEVTEATGGVSYWQGNGDPVTLEPYFSDIGRRLDNQYELRFMTPIGGKAQMANLKLKISAEAKVDAPGEVYLHPAAE